MRTTNTFYDVLGILLLPFGLMIVIIIYGALQIYYFGTEIVRVLDV